MKRMPDGAKITTIEGVGTPEKLHALHRAFIKYGSAQCGFCIPGFIVSAKALPAEKPEPSREEVDPGLPSITRLPLIRYRTGDISRFAPSDQRKT